MKKPRPSIRQVQLAVRRYLIASSVFKKAIDRRESAHAKVLELLTVGQTVVVADAVYTVVDNFATKNVAFKPAAVRRFELKEKKT